MANEGYTTATDFADYLVKEKIYPLERLTKYLQKWSIMLKKIKKI